MKRVTISDIYSALIKGVNFDKSDAAMSKTNGHTPLLRANNISDMHINLDGLMYVKSDLIKQEQYLCEGDIVFVTSSGSKHLVGKSALVSGLSKDITIGAFNSLLRFSADIEPRYIFYIMNSPLFKAHMASRLAGANINNIKRNDVLDFELLIPFKNDKPDLTEQKRIADGLDIIFSETERGLKVAELGEKQATALEQSLLFNVFGNYSNASWQTKVISDIAEVNPKKDFSAMAKSAEVSFVPMDSVDDVTGRITKQLKRTLGSVSKGYTFFRDRDVIFAKITPCMENGKCAVVKDLVNGVGFGSTEFYVLRAKENILPEYLWHFFRQERIRKEATLHFTGAAGHKRVPKDFIENLELPVPFKNGEPDLVAQRHIVEKMDATFILTERINDALRKQKRSFSLLRLSILNNSFQAQT